MARRALFLDRDGTLVADVGYPRDPEAMVLVPGAAEALRAARREGWALVVISNQSGVARGLVTPDEMRRVQARVEELYRAEGVTFDGAYFCVHGPDDGCACRKPRPGMLLDAARELGLELSASVMVGDKPSDVLAGEAAGCAAVGFGEGDFEGGPRESAMSAKPAVCRTWAEVSTWLSSLPQRRGNR